MGDLPITDSNIYSNEARHGTGGGVFQNEVVGLRVRVPVCEGVKPERATCVGYAVRASL